jgi:hypothetical protein
MNREPSPSVFVANGASLIVLSVAFGYLYDLTNHLALRG